MTNILDMKQMVGNVKQTYNDVRQIYYLPAFSSKAINIPYMREIIKEESEYVKVRNCDMYQVFVA